MKIFLLTLALCVSAAAQSLTATTPDGKQVILNPDGTWKFATADSSATLSIEAALIYQSGDVKPAARTAFYLLDESPLDILTAAKVQPVQGVGDSNPQTRILFNLARLQSARCDDCPRFAADVQKAIAPHTVKAIATGFDGKGVFDSVKPGTYHLYGSWSVGENSVLWISKIELKVGATNIKLDQNNAALAF